MNTLLITCGYYHHIHTYTETAINIGYSCKLLTGDMKVFIIDELGKEEVRKQLMDAKDEMTRIREKVDLGRAPSPEGTDSSMGSPTGPPFGIVINGHSLVCSSIVLYILYYCSLFSYKL